MATTMWRAAKGEGVGNVFLRQVPVPDPVPEEVMTRTRVIKSPCTRPNRALEKLSVFGSLG